MSLAYLYMCIWMHLNQSRNQIFAKCRNTIKEAMLRNLKFKICKDFDQKFKHRTCSPIFPSTTFGFTEICAQYQNFGGNRPMKMVQRCCAKDFRITSQSRRRAQSLTAIWPTNTAEPSFPRARLLRISRNLSCPGALDPLSPPRDHASRRQVYWPSPCHRPVSSPLAPPLPGPASHLSAYPS